MNIKNKTNTDTDGIITIDRRDLEVKVVSYYDSIGYLSERTRPGAKFVNGHYISNSWDFFNCFDGISIMDGSVVLWQACSGTTFRDHQKKIEKLFPFTKIPIQEIDYFHKVGARWHFSITRRTLMGWQYFGDVACATNVLNRADNNLSIPIS